MRAIRDRLGKQPVSTDWSRLGLAAFFVVGGTLHFVFAPAYVRIIPPWLPDPHDLVMISGLCEIAGGLLVLHRRLRPVAGWGLIALAVAVWPANLQMFVNAHTTHAPAWAQLLLFLRLPLQVLIIWWIWSATRRDAR